MPNKNGSMYGLTILSPIIDDEKATPSHDLQIRNYLAKLSFREDSPFALAPGTHLDLVGGFTPSMRETDDSAIRRAAVFVDTRAGATKEAGDIVQPLASGALTVDAIRGDLYDLARGRVPGRTARDEITLFKSVGSALEDLAAAQLAFEADGQD